MWLKNESPKAFWDSVKNQFYNDDNPPWVILFPALTQNIAPLAKSFLQKKLFVVAIVDYLLVFFNFFVFIGQDFFPNLCSSHRSSLLFCLNCVIINGFEFDCNLFRHFFSPIRFPNVNIFTVETCKEKSWNRTCFSYLRCRLDVMFKVF